MALPSLNRSFVTSKTINNNSIKSFNKGLAPALSGAMSMAKKTYDIYFENDTMSNNKGFRESAEYCKDYIRTYNGTNESYFADYKGGTVEVVCNETEEVVYSEEVL